VTMDDVELSDSSLPFLRCLAEISSPYPNTGAILDFCVASHYILCCTGFGVLLFIYYNNRESSMRLTTSNFSSFFCCHVPKVHFMLHLFLEHLLPSLCRTMTLSCQ